MPSPEAIAASPPHPTGWAAGAGAGAGISGSSSGCVPREACWKKWSGQLRGRRAVAAFWVRVPKLLQRLVALRDDRAQALAQRLELRLGLARQRIGPAPHATELGPEPHADELRLRHREVAPVARRLPVASQHLDEGEVQVIDEIVELIVGRAHRGLRHHLVAPDAKLALALLLQALPQLGERRAVLLGPATSKVRVERRRATAITQLPRAKLAQPRRPCLAHFVTGRPGPRRRALAARAPSSPAAPGGGRKALEIRVSPPGDQVSGRAGGSLAAAGTGRKGVAKGSGAAGTRSQALQEGPAG